MQVGAAETTEITLGSNKAVGAKFDGSDWGSGFCSTSRPCASCSEKTSDARVEEDRSFVLVDRLVDNDTPASAGCSCRNIPRSPISCCKPERTPSTARYARPSRHGVRAWQATITESPATAPQRSWGQNKICSPRHAKVERSVNPRRDPHRRVRAPHGAGSSPYAARCGTSRSEGPPGIAAASFAARRNPDRKGQFCGGKVSDVLVSRPVMGKKPA